MAVNIASRRLAPFPDMPVEDNTNTIETYLYALYRNQATGLIIYGGPGSGTTQLLNYLAMNLNELEGALALGPFGMSQYRGQINPERIWRDLARQIANSMAAAGIDVPNPSEQWPAELTVSEIREFVGVAFATAIKTGTTRLVLLLDDFDDTHPRAAVSIANQIRALYDQHKAHFSFVLVAESDLEMLRTTQHVYSPLDGVSDSYHLLDLAQTEMIAHARDYYTQLASKDIVPQLLTPTDLDQLWFFTRGYPALVNAFLRDLHQSRLANPEYSLEAAKDARLKMYDRVEPLKTGIRELERLANLNARGFNPANLLYELADRHVSYDPQDRQVRMLLAMGILGWRGDAISWRNEFLRQFWEEYARGKQLLASWVGRPQWFQSSELSAQGKIYVDLFLDFGDFLENEDGNFDQLRGTQRWLKGLRKLAHAVDNNNAGDLSVHADNGRRLKNSPYILWRDQQRLINIGHDLNIFRGQTIRKSFMPIYQMSMESFENQLDPAIEWLMGTMPSSFDTSAKQVAQEILKNEWQRWTNVRLQLTRDGSVHVTFVREINDPLPLMQIMHELLGLERELDGGGPLEMSVQWELALIAIMAFIWQVLGENNSIPELGIRWRAIRPRSIEEIYPLRDRYVIYQLQKVCNCRFQGLRRKPDRRIIDLDKLEDLRQCDRLDEEMQRPFNYARELSTLLEGVMVGRAGNGNKSERSGIFPPLTLREVKGFLNNDLSSWQNEYAATTLDNALLIFQTQKKAPAISVADNKERPNAEIHANDWCQVCQEYEQREIEDIYFPERKVAYEDYWQCLVLGLTYVVELRWSGQWIAWRTTEELDELARKREESHDGLSLAQIEEQIVELTHTVALTTRLLAHLRDAAIPMFMAGADYAARKYQRLIEVSGLLAAINNAEENINALNAYLYNAEQQRMQKTIAYDQQVQQQKSEDTAKIIGVIGGVFAVLTMLIALPSMWIDFGPDTTIGNFLISHLAEFPYLPKGVPISSGANISLKYGFLCFSTMVIVTILVGTGVWYWRQYLRKDKANAT